MFCYFSSLLFWEILALGLTHLPLKMENLVANMEFWVTLSTKRILMMIVALISMGIAVWATNLCLVQTKQIVKIVSEVFLMNFMN